MAAGPGKVIDSGQRAAMQAAVGDVVIRTKYGGTEITGDGEHGVSPTGARQVRGSSRPKGRQGGALCMEPAQSRPGGL